MTNPSDLVFAGGDDFPLAHRGAAVVIGNFDGVHRGHLALIRRAVDVAAGGPVVALTFEPHPREFFSSAPMFRLTSAREKARLLKQAGVDAVVVLAFDGGLASIAPGRFVETILDERLGARSVVVGWNFHFGRNRAGSPGFLADVCDRIGIRSEIVEPFGDAAPVSSTGIRKLLAEGRFEDATTALGRPWRTEARLSEQRAGLHGAACACLELPEGVQIAPGRYDVRIGDGRQEWRGIAAVRRADGASVTVVETAGVQDFQRDSSSDVYVELHGRIDA